MAAKVTSGLGDCNILCFAHPPGDARTLPYDTLASKSEQKGSAGSAPLHPGRTTAAGILRPRSSAAYVLDAHRAHSVLERRLLQEDPPGLCPPLR